MARIAATVAALVMLAGCTSTGGTTPTTTTTTASTATTVPATTSTATTEPPLSQKAADREWRRNGGQELIAGITDALDELADSIPDGMAAACVGLRDAAQAAINGEQHPAPVVNAYWHTAITSAREAADKCVETIATGDPETLDDFMWALDRATRSFESATTAVKNLD